jgi:hypothetical protein
VAALSADEDAACRYCRLGEHQDRAGHAERPLELEPKKVGGAGVGLESPVFDIRVPAGERGPVERERRRGGGAWPAIGASAPSFRPVRYSASAIRSPAVRAEPCAFIMPWVRESTMKLGDIALKDARVGARAVGTIWQAAQSRSNSAD